jgi:hypothetical protein
MVVLYGIRLDELAAHVLPGFFRQPAALHLVSERIAFLEVRVDVLRIERERAVGRGNRGIVVVRIELGLGKSREHCRIVGKARSDLAGFRH